MFLSPVTSIRGPARVLGAAAAALLVVGAGAAVGIGTSGGASRPGSVVGGVAPSSASGGGPISNGTTTTAAPAIPPPTAAPAPARIASASAPVAPAQSSDRTGTGASATDPASASASATPAGGTGAPPGGGTGPPSGGGGVPGTPTPGVYSYATSGNETFLARTSDYPASTTITVSRQGCGVSARWDASSGDSTTVMECPVAGGVHVVSQTSTVDAGGYHYTTTFACDPDAFVPTSGTPGRNWAWSCHAANGETATQQVQLIGPQVVTVGAASVPTEHVRVVSTLSGPQQGTVTTDYWLTSDALPARETSSVRASQSGVTYSSDYTLVLRSLTPTG